MQLKLERRFARSFKLHNSFTTAIFYNNCQNGLFSFHSDLSKLKWSVNTSFLAQASSNFLTRPSKAVWTMLIINHVYLVSL